MSLNAQTRRALKKILHAAGIEPSRMVQGIGKWSLTKAASQQRLTEQMAILRKIVPNISNQEPGAVENFNDFWEINRRAMHAWQVRIMGRLMNRFSESPMRIVDIGDSAGTHCLYFRSMAEEDKSVETLSLNLDPRAIELIKSRGLPALLRRAEDITPEDIGGEVDIFTSFEMVEHLHNPVIFLKRLAGCNTGRLLFITVPFMHRSRVALHHIRNRKTEAVYAGGVHIFELNPQDWKLLFQHAGWKVVEEEIYYQYPRLLPIISKLLRSFWRIWDYEGFWAAVLERDDTYSRIYQDWEE